MEFLLVIGVFALTIAFDFGFAYVLTLAINWLLPTFGIAFTVTFWQVFVIMFIVSLVKKLLFK